MTPDQASRKGTAFRTTRVAPDSHPGATSGEELPPAVLQ